MPSSRQSRFLVLAQLRSSSFGPQLTLREPDSIGPFVVCRAVEGYDALAGGPNRKIQFPPARHPGPGPQEISAEIGKGNIISWIAFEKKSSSSKRTKLAALR